jgi:hypothetical protein
MVKLSRAEAKRQGLRYYDTGRPCRRGHMAWRYTSSGGCSDCIAEDTRGGGVIERRKSSHTGALIGVTFRLYDYDWPLVRDTAAELARSVYPDTVIGKPVAPHSPAAGTSIYTVRVPAEYEQLIADTARALWNSHRIDVQARRAEILRSVVAMAEVR